MIYNHPALGKKKSSKKSLKAQNHHDIHAHKESVNFCLGLG